MANITTPELYYKYFIKKGDERDRLFKVLTGIFNIERGLYPGSFVHITPSFVIPEMVYIDNDKRCKNFFSDKKTLEYISKRKAYPQSPVIRFHEVDFTNECPEKENNFDLLISLYAGFVSKYCKSYLKKGGILLANNSHGDSSLAHNDLSFEFIGVVKRKGDHFTFTEKNLDSYFITKNGNPVDEKKIIATMRGAGFTKTGYAYIFKKIL